MLSDAPTIRVSTRNGFRSEIVSIDAMDIVQFLEARLAEDEEAARDAAGWDSSGSVRDEGRWRRDGVNSVIDSARRMVVYGDGAAPDDSKAEHIVRHDPACVLREVAAKRAIIVALKDGDLRLFSGLWKAIELLAVPYSDHPDYEKVESIFPDRPTDKTRLM